MIFRDHNGKLHDIKKLTYTRDSNYYRAILIAKKKVLPLQDCDEKQKMLDILNFVPCKKVVQA